MANETLITVVGNLTADPEGRSVNGVTVVNFTIASTPRRFDKQTNDWVDEEALFMRAQAWRDLADNIVQNLGKGTKVIAQGFLKQRTFETKEGEKRTVMELDVQEIGAAISRFKPNAQRAGQPRQQGQPSARGSESPQQDNWGATSAGFDPNVPF